MASSPSIDINVVQGEPLNDLRATFQAIAKTFNITTPDFFNKLGDLMLSSQNFNLGNFQTKFFGLLTQYSKGLVYQGQAGGADVVPADLTPSQSGIRGGPNTTKLATPSINPRTARQEVKFQSPSATGDKSATSEVNIDVEISKIVNNLFSTATRTGTTNNISVFLYNTIPYIASGILSGLVQTFKTGLTPSAIGTAAIGAATGGLAGNATGFGGGAMQYYTPDELIYFAAANFYTIQFKRGITIKDLTVGPSMQFNPGNNISNMSAQVAALIPNVNINTIAANALNSASSALLGLTGATRPTDAGTGIRGRQPDLALLLQKYLANLNNFPEDSADVDVTGRDNTEWTIDISVRSNDYHIWQDDKGNKNVSFDAMDKIARDYRGLNNIGSIYIWPVDPKAGAPSAIPFEFNPVIGEGDMAARYQSMQILSRIGELQSFVGTASLPVQVGVTYWALSEIYDTNSTELSHLSYFSLFRLQQIEMVFRSLVLPFFPVDNTISTGYRYMRPPLIKIIMGNYNQANTSDALGTPFANILRYPDAVIGPNRFANVSGMNYRNYRTFICTSVKIDKNLADFPIYYDNTNGIKDTHGFNVDMSLIEVAPSYVDSLPSFADYYQNAST
jgi:hypothetical protein